MGEKRYGVAVRGRAAKPGIGGGDFPCATGLFSIPRDRLPQHFRLWLTCWGNYRGSKKVSDVSDIAYRDVFDTDIAASISDERLACGQG